MAVQTDTLAALDACFSTDLAALTGRLPTRSLTPTQFIDLVEEVRDLLTDSRLPHHEDASDDLHHAADHLTEALTSPADEQHTLLAQARTHLRSAIASAN
ncbi:hypothetical protein [Streptomyces drozdowiczii]|uniref:Uncharacterized protein n=1 Tax=Streptomyces drozdowiczii TaxID=202862 RepID=A0ABY6Q1F4_9ACTN|nr:hypothetical protein [Streptomyces drozdowiczii]MCX0247979.1 hypothetical protein [Streptomyces drozdowiczii]UZK58241.1 hypothetical protein NEH16_32905 [Streptomyces drozdowiczii]